MHYLNHVVSDDAVVVITDEGLKTIHKTNPYFTELVSNLNQGNYEKGIYLIDVAGRVQYHSKGQFKMRGGRIFHKHTLIPESLSNRIIQFADVGAGFKPLLKFWENCLKNPSKRSRKHLWPFMDHNHIPLTEDGCFIAYKRVTEDFMDCHTRTISNKVGKVVWMNRRKVDPDPKETCSRGLHVAAYGYANNMYSNGNLVAVKVNPRDVVAVPEDYNGEKMRVCRYKVMEKVSGPRKELVYAEYREGSVVVVFPNLDDAQNNFVGKVIKVFEREDNTVLYQIRKVNSDEIVEFPQHHLAWLDSDREEEKEEEICPDCQEVECVCADLYDDDEDEEDED